MIRVLIVDDEALIRTGFTHILNSADDIDVVGAVVGSQALDDMARLKPDVVLLDIRMPDVDGLTILRRVADLDQKPLVAILTTFDADEYVTQALQLGAAGFLLKDTEPELLIQQVRSLSTDGAILSPRVTQTVVSGYLEGSSSKAEHRRVDSLSGREREVLVLLGEGLSNVDISSRLYLGVGTVKDHVSAIFSKLDVSNRVQAALVAERAGLLKSSGSV